jgi:hypothetical protein
MFAKKAQQNTFFIAILSIAFVAFMFAYQNVFAAPNQQINYQGKLTDDTGVTVANGTYNVRFKLYTTPSGGGEIWSETASTTITSGLFSYMLGSTSPLTAVDFNQTLYLGVEIGGTGSPTWDGEMTPRKILGTVPAAFESLSLGGATSTQYLRSDTADTATGLLTFSNGLISQASSTITELNSVNATTTNLHISGSLFDVNSSAGQTGYVLQATASGLEWVATSTLGLAASTSAHDAVTLAGSYDYLTLSGQQITLNQITDGWERWYRSNKLYKWIGRLFERFDPDARQ